MPTLNGGENLTEEVIVQAEEKISMPEEISEPQKISKPAQVESFKFPEITLPPQNNLPAPNYEPPKKYEPPQKIHSRLLKTEFYLGGALFNQDAHKDDRERIRRADWQRMQARLHISNDTGDIW
ncbi:MAG: hypothetical protein IKZ53_05425 [Selenomonadaceae bacterium]|nr:hypothetical protein [Selenomonadaceae bacterium]